MNLNDIKAVYFIGVGGIGMSAIARFFLYKQVFVAGYDKTATPLTLKLEEEGAEIHYEDDTQRIPEPCRDPKSTLVIYTPAVPATHQELNWFREGGFEVQKRAQVLGTLTRSHRGLCVAGTHGKTTTSSMCAHIMHNSHLGCNAFLGGILKNYGTNYLLSDSDYVVIEADEYDRSFHWLRPWATVITATDPDHLDIYGTEEAYLESFRHYTTLIQPGGTLLVNKAVKIEPQVAEDVKCYSYGAADGQFHAANIKIEDGEISFDFISPLGNVEGIQLGQPVPINIENSVAAMALAQIAGCTPDELRNGMATYQGVQRRFDYILKDDRHVLISDYAHHPKEIYQSAKSIRTLYPNRHITAIFQPHLYTRTRDFYKDFAESLSQLDEVVLTDIYPAREEPIPGVTSRLIYDNLADKVEKEMIATDHVLDYVEKRDFDVLILLGAGDLDNKAKEIAQLLEKK